jgi:hypothetical protein
MSESPTARRRTRRTVRFLLPLLVVSLAGCASIPTSGPVKAGGDPRLQRVEDVVRSIGQPPTPGAKPEDIVAGFLQSSADFQSDHEVARLYLAPRARQRWRPQTGTVVADRVAPLPLSGGVVSVEGSEVGRIDGEGIFRRTPSGTPVTSGFGMERVDGEWRIATLDDGLILSTADVAETYRQVSLYFLAPSGNTVVPDVVLVPELPGLTTKLVARLLRGPTAAMRDAVDTSFPQGTALEVGSVPVRDGVATVRLNDAALAADDAARERMSAQIVWTLKQLSEVLRVRITAGGENLLVSGVAEELPRDSWDTYDPDRLPPSPSAYVVQDGRVGRYLEGQFEPVPGLAGTGDPALRSPAVSLDASRVAAVSTDGRTVYVGALARGEGLLPRVRGTDLSPPSWDPDNNLWVVDRATGQLWYLANGADAPQEVSVAGSPDLTAVAVARDGTRVALIVGSGKAARIKVGPVVRAETANPDIEGGETVSVPSVHEPVPDLRSARDVAWADATTLAVLGSRDGLPVAPYYLDTDGYTITDTEPLAGPVTITAAPPLQPQENPLVVGTTDGELMQFTSGGGWQPLGAGTDPAYPG